MARHGGPAELDDVSVPVAIALAMTMAGGIVLAWLWIIDDPPAVVVGLAVALWAAGAVLVGVFAARDSRREGDSIGEAIGRGLKTLLRWMWAFFP